MATRRLDPTDVELFKRLRLAALVSDPDTLASTSARESQFDGATWMSGLTGEADRPGCIIVDEIDGEPVGMTGICVSHEPDDTLLWGMWVSPAARGRGSGRRLLDAALAWAVEQGAATTTLWVVRTNATAIGLYESAGFRATAAAQPLPSNACAEELAMRRRLKPIERTEP